MGGALDGKLADLKVWWNGAQNHAVSKGQSDFKSVFKEKRPDSNDQTHHFVAYLSAGINGEWTASTVHEVLDDNLADKRLGNAAYQLGAELNDVGDPNPSHIRDLLRTIGQRIKRDFCDIKQ